MKDFTEFKRELDCISYTKEELEILNGIRKNVPAKDFLDLLDKTINLNDAENTMKLLGYEYPS